MLNIKIGSGYRINNAGFLTRVRITAKREGSAPSIQFSRVTQKLYWTFMKTRLKGLLRNRIYQVQIRILIRSVFRNQVGGGEGKFRDVSIHYVQRWTKLEILNVQVLTHSVQYLLYI